MPATATRLITAEEFAAMEDPMNGPTQELVQGEILDMPLTQGDHGIICGEICWLIKNAVKPNKLGWVTTNDAGVILERDPDTTRGPDVGFWSIERQPTRPKGYLEIPPDIAVEVLSPSDNRKAVRDKVHEYVAAGVRLVWVVDPEDKTVMVYSGTMRGVEYDEADTLDGGEVLPGFTCKVADFFA